MKKRFGQYFLNDPYVLERIAAAIYPKNTDTLVEIGPGRGALTNHLLAKCGRLVLVEIDHDLLALLETKYKQQENVILYQRNALQFDFLVLKTDDQLLRMVGNLPYNISIPLLFHLFSQITCIKDMHFMLQKEVVLRLTALVGSTNYGRLSVMAQYFCDNTLLFTVPPDAFIPIPRVESAVVRLIPRRNPALTVKNLEHFSAIIKEAFSYRRKTISNALKKIININQWKTIDINGQLRPQELTVEDFIKISNITT
ncbi:Ribosomal RNA small subunit methyltransferase A [Coxiella endosymbiont of Amblyomma nuttalli]|nr:16S rRNA (adenine(1518)-N(6)/adenine(1519)-N(6))-dimethyltransferase RsmA [Coxiella endosymbiont of Amblyomma nuttalli]QTS83585.1 Ribosomal RNA small subunit methyltransferase A [Coxiella endosymbiont of Amblyomma nuttalli]